MFMYVCLSGCVYASMCACCACENVCVCVCVSVCMSVYVCVCAVVYACACPMLIFFKRDVFFLELVANGSQMYNEEWVKELKCCSRGLPMPC